MNDYLVKPFNPEALYAMLGLWVSRPDARVPALHADADVDAGSDWGTDSDPRESPADPRPHASPITADQPRIDSLLAELDQLLAYDDAEANRLFARIAATLRLALGEEIMLLGQLIDAYDYPTTLARVRALRAHH